MQVAGSSLSNKILADMGFCQAPSVPNLFVLIQKDVLVAIIAKIVDESPLSGTPCITDPLISCISAKWQLCTISNGPVHLRYFGPNHHQNDDYSTVVDGIEKLARIATIPISHIRRRELHSKKTSIKAQGFASLNSTVW